MNIRAATAYLEDVEHADARAAKAAARVLVGLLESHWFFRSWWCEALEPCMAVSPRMVGRPDTVVARLAHHFGLRVYGEAPTCHTCQRPLSLADVRVSVPTGRCHSCPPITQAAVPAPRSGQHAARQDVTSPATKRNGGGR